MFSLGIANNGCALSCGRRSGLETMVVARRHEKVCMRRVTEATKDREVMLLRARNLVLDSIYICIPVETECSDSGRLRVSRPSICNWPRM